GEPVSAAVDEAVDEQLVLVDAGRRGRVDVGEVCPVLSGVDQVGTTVDLDRRGFDPALVEVGGDLGFEFGLGMEFCGHNPDDGDGDERTADGECDEGLLHEVSFSDHGDRVTHDPSGAGTLGPRPIGRSGSADRPVHTDAASLFAISAGLSTMPVDGVTAPESEGSSDGSHPSATETGARKRPGSVSDPGLSQVEMAGIEPASVGRLSGLLRAQFVKQFLRFWPLHEHMDQRTELSKSPSDTPNEYLKQWLPKRRQAPERKRL